MGARRGRAHHPRVVKQPTSHTATAANQVWSWDITYLPSPVRGQYYYLYLFEDLYSRKAVAWEVHTEEKWRSCRRDRPEGRYGGAMLAAALSPAF